MHIHFNKLRVDESLGNCNIHLSYMSSYENVLRQTPINPIVTTADQRTPGG